MAGFVLAHHSDGGSVAEDPLFLQLVRETARLKGLPQDPPVLAAPGLALAKFDTHSSLHRGAAVHRESGSWMVAFGTVVAGSRGPRSDLSPLLEDVLQRGDAALADVDGLFGLAWYDGPRRRLAVATDPLGFGAFYRRRIGNVEYASTSALALASLAPCRPDEHAIHCFLSTGNVYGGHTLFEEVRRLRAATVWEPHTADPAERIYWTLARDESVVALDFEESVETSIRTLDGIVPRSVRDDGPIWIDLTGGFDSRVIALFMARNEREFLANCVGTPDAVDVRIAREIVRRTGWRLEVIDYPNDWADRRLDSLPRALGAGDGTLEALHLRNVLFVHDEKLARGGADVTGLVMGSGGELWRGFFWRQELMDLGKTSRVNFDRLLDFRVLKPLDRRLLRSPEKLDRLRTELTDLFREVADRHANDLNVSKLDAIYAFKNTAHTGAYASAALGTMRGIAPLFLKDALRCAFSIDYRWRNQDRLFRRMFERCDPALAGIRTSWGGPATSVTPATFVRFLPYYMFWVRRFVQRVARKLVGHPLWPEPRVDSFPRHRWRVAMLERADAQGWFDTARMNTGSLYDASALADLRLRASSPDFGADELLGKMLTVELACREAGVSL